MAATIKDIKEKTGLSLATISKFLNGGNVLPENREKIAAAGHPDVVVILVTNSDDYENLTIQTGACNVLDKVIQV